MPALTPNTLPPLSRRFVAVLSAALLLLLSASAVSPALHDHLHDHETDHTSPSHVCAVALFATGLVLSFATLAVAPRSTPFALLPTDASSVCFASPRHLHPPERGPPAR